MIAYQHNPLFPKRKGTPSTAGIIAAREAAKDRTIATYAATITAQASQIADLKRRLVEAVQRERRAAKRENYRKRMLSAASESSEGTR